MLTADDYRDQRNRFNAAVREQTNPAIRERLRSLATLCLLLESDPGHEQRHARYVAAARDFDNYVSKRGAYAPDGVLSGAVNPAAVEQRLAEIRAGHEGQA